MCRAIAGTSLEEDIVRVQASWLTIEPVKRVAAELYFVKSFELDSTLKLLGVGGRQSLVHAAGPLTPLASSWRSRCSNNREYP